MALGCRALESIVPGPDFGSNKFDWFSKRFKNVKTVDIEENDSLLSRPYEWRLSMKTGEVMERNLTSKEYSMDFPFINGCFTGVKNKYGYCQVVDADASSIAGDFISLNKSQVPVTSYILTYKSLIGSL